MEPNKAQSWRQEPTMWLFSGLLLTVVIASTITFWLAWRSDDGLVVDDYYKRSNEIGVDLKRDQQASALDLSAQLMLGQDGQDVRLLLLSRNLPPQLQLKLAHPTRAGKDQQLTLQQQGGGFYVGKLSSPLLAQRWLVEVGTQEWRLRGEAELVAGSQLKLESAKNIK